MTEHADMSPEVRDHELAEILRALIKGNGDGVQVSTEYPSGRHTVKFGDGPEIMITRTQWLALQAERVAQMSRESRERLAHNPGARQWF